MTTKPIKVLLVEASGRGFLSHYSHALAYGLHLNGVDTQLMTGIRDELSAWEVPYTKQSCLLKGFAGWHCIKKYITKVNPDVVHLQWVDNPLRAIRFISWAQCRGIKVIYTPHNILPHEKRWLLMPLYRILYRKMDKVVVRDKNLSWALEEILDTPKDSIQYIPGSPNMLALQTLWKGVYSIGKSKKKKDNQLLFFGHGCKRKGLDLLLQAISKSDDSSLSSVHLTIAGEGVLNDIPQRLIEDVENRIKLTVHNQYIKPEKVAKLFTKADLLLMPYTRLCKSPLLDLAASFKVPVLRSDRVKGANFEEGKHGLTFHHNNNEDLLNLIKERDWIKKN